MDLICTDYLAENHILKYLWQHYVIQRMSIVKVYVSVT